MCDVLFYAVLRLCCAVRAAPSRQWHWATTQLEMKRFVLSQKPGGAWLAATCVVAVVMAVVAVLAVGTSTVDVGRYTERISVRVCV